MNAEEKKTTSNIAKMGMASDIVAILTILASIPYELGQLSVTIPPVAKPWVAGIGLFATLGLRMWQRWQELKSTQS